MIAVAPGVLEEIVVRGVLLPSLVGRLGPAWAILASAFLFAAMHFDLYRFLFTFTIGLILGALGVAWMLLLLYTMAQSATKQGLHDRYAKTIVVKARRRAR